MRQDNSSLNFPSLNIPEEIDTFSEEFDSYEHQYANRYAATCQGDGRLGCAPVMKDQRLSKTDGSTVQCPTTATVN